MKKYLLLIIPVVFLITGYLVDNKKDNSIRNRQSFNEDWLFQKGDYKKASQIQFDDASWRKLNLPHDWAIEGPFDPKHDARTGGLPISGVAWYRKSFVPQEEWKGYVVTLEFDGVMNNSEVFINGKKVGERPFGYIGFEVDLTEYLIYGKDNQIAVKVAPEELSARWYPGAGIYRNVWLEVKSNVHVTHWGTFVTTPKVTEKEAIVSIQTTINAAKEVQGIHSLKTVILDPNGKEITKAVKQIVFDNQTDIITQKFEINNPQLWDLEHPNQYQAVSYIDDGDQIIDTYKTKFGIRNIEFTQEGFYLNGKKTSFKGVCMHHDLGPLGAAVNYRATQRQLELLKTMGVNAIRTAHNPPSPEQLALCDEMGILVQVEAFDEWQKGKVANGYHKFWKKWHEKDLRDMIKRDRNHPSVVMWSIGNEVKEQRKKNARKITKHLVDICHDEDPTRLVTAGLSAYPQPIDNGMADELDLVGLNYKPTLYDTVVKNHPDFIVYGSETSSVVSSRGEYHFPLENYEKHPSKQITSYDIISPPWAYPQDFETYAQDNMKYTLGEFVWTGFDYLGEPTPFNGKDHLTHGKWGGDWPSRSSYFGIFDLSGFPKDRFYYYQSQWTETPMVHILPHWNWEGMEGQEVPVYCYTNADEAELFLNGKSLGKKVMGVDKTTIPADFWYWKKPETTWDSPYRLNWNVNYEPGELKVIAYKQGKKVAEKVIITSGKPSKMTLTPDRETIQADGYDLSFITVKVEDDKGNFTPKADNLITFDIEGPATIAAVGNGNAATVEPFQANYRKAFNGLCLLVVKSKKGASGKVKITAKSEGLQSETVWVNTI
ncbi:DUF4982 domain-containing protein [Flammeovirga sp. MY04]|uniref:beta-galactosidase GalB n=1 Tax=Flammeovirga sp. MY04 TaxID=1191459 RepID=UPI0008060F01|nr:beta-galactosidase GalB [Flammeovirga sp. MY04]ANQ52467.1 DUF4982 domain-containing protein [Flammeovirga sp. MY04]